MNKDINIVLNTIDYATATWLDLQVADGNVTIGEEYSFPWKKLFSAEKQSAVAEVAAIQKARIDSVTVGAEYSFILTQQVDSGLIVERISYTASTGDTYGDVSAAWKSIVDAHASAGRIKIASTALSTVTLGHTNDTLTITSSPGYALLSVSNASNSVTLNASATTGVPAKNAGADLLALGVVDSFAGTLPTSGVDYTSYKLGLKLPKGHGGFNGQTSDQEVTLNIYLNEAETDFGDLEDDIDALLSGNGPASANTDWAFADALAV